MSENKVHETKLAEEQAKAAQARCAHSSGHLAWKIVGGVVLALVATGVIANLNDIRRYIRISTM